MAVNNDPEAPIFNIADIAIRGRSVRGAAGAFERCKKQKGW
ncbi:MAG: hypothetical protein ACLUD2_12255 [Clostridium sp.]